MKNWETRFISYYIKKDGKLTPFVFYTEQKPGDEITYYYYIQEKNGASKFTDRWKFLHYCGGSFIANPGTKWEIEASVNDIVIRLRKFSIKKALQTFSVPYTACLILWLWDCMMAHEILQNVGLFYLKLASTINLFFSLLMLIAYQTLLSKKYLIDEFDQEKIPEHNL